jgi:hypothetical protein
MPAVFWRTAKGERLERDPEQERVHLSAPVGGRKRLCKYNENGGGDPQISAFFYLAERKSGFRETPAKHSCFQFLSARKYVRGPKIAQFDARLT